MSFRSVVSLQLAILCVMLTSYFVIKLHFNVFSLWTPKLKLDVEDILPSAVI